MEPVPEKPRPTNHVPELKSSVKFNWLVDEADTIHSKHMLAQADPAVAVTRSGQIVKPLKRLQDWKLLFVLGKTDV